MLSEIAAYLEKSYQKLNVENIFKRRRKCI